MNEQNNEVKVTEVTPGRYEIVDHPKHKGLVGRQVEITKGSKKPGFVNGQLVSKKDGSLQKTEISIALAAIKPYVAPEAAPAEGEAEAV